MYSLKRDGEEIHWHTGQVVKRCDGNTAGKIPFGPVRCTDCVTRQEATLIRCNP